MNSWRGKLQHLWQRWHGEAFFVPRLGLDLQPYIDTQQAQAVHHLSRYHWAAQVLADYPECRVLDIACGAGYGSYLLAQACPQLQITAVDYDARAVAYGQQHYAHPKVQIKRGNMVTWRSLPDTVSLGEFDVIISFDTLEHLAYREIALQQVVEHLVPKGMLLFSTPCKAHLDLTPAWDEHYLEYSDVALEDLMRRYFKKVLRPDRKLMQKDYPALDFWQDLNAEKARYSLRANPLVCLNPIRLKRSAVKLHPQALG